MTKTNKPAALTTDEATRKLAELVTLRWPAYNDACPLDTAHRHIDKALDYGRAWKWQAAEKSLKAAYKALGAEPPDATGYDWHCGNHPIQIYMRENKIN